LIDGLQLSDQQVNNNMLSGSTAEGPHVTYILKDQRSQHKEAQLHSVENPTYGMKDKDDILFRVGRPTKKHNKQLTNMTLCTQSHPADVCVVT
jgi:hypothetical protein